MTSIDAFLQVVYSFYNSAFQPLLAAGPYVSLAAFSAGLAAIFSVIYWLLLDIEKADEIKEKVQEKQEKMKEAREEDRDEEVSEHMQETMKLNQKLMMLNIKPMIATFLFVGLFFPWLGATFAPSVDVEQTGEGEFRGNLSYAGQTTPVTVRNSSEVLVEANGQEAREGDTFRALGVEWQVTGFGKGGGGFLFFGGGGDGLSLKLNAEFIELPFSLPFIGKALNWLGFYILIAMPLTFGLRKLLGVA